MSAQKLSGAVADTSPLLFLHRADAMELLGALFEAIYVPGAVLLELEQGARAGHGVPDLTVHPWICVLEPRIMPSEWLALDLGQGELAAMALAMEHPEWLVLLDDAQARRIAKAAGVNVWGTLKVLLEAKQAGFVPGVAPLLERMTEAGMWLSDGLKMRILTLAGEGK